MISRRKLLETTILLGAVKASSGKPGRAASNRFPEEQSQLLEDIERAGFLYFWEQAFRKPASFATASRFAATIAAGSPVSPQPASG